MNDERNRQKFKEKEIYTHVDEVGSLTDRLIQRELETMGLLNQTSITRQITPDSLINISSILIEKIARFFLIDLIIVSDYLK